MNAEQSKSFYSGVLGLNLVSQDSFALVYDVQGITLRITTVKEFRPAPFTVLGWNVSNIEAVAIELQKSSVRFERFVGLEQDQFAIWTAPGGNARVAWFKDPDGNVLSISQHS